MSNINKEIYRSRLKDIRWQEVKNTIQIRDQFTCQKCKGNKHTLPEGTLLEVHHRHYLPLRAPWDYPEQLLVLLCSECHKEEETTADILKEMAPALHFHGYFNTEIRDFVNKLIEDKIQQSKNG